MLEPKVIEALQKLWINNEARLQVAAVFIRSIKDAHLAWDHCNIEKS